MLRGVPNNGSPGIVLKNLDNNQPSSSFPLDADFYVTTLLNIPPPLSHSHTPTHTQHTHTHTQHTHTHARIPEGLWQNSKNRLQRLILNDENIDKNNTYYSSNDNDNINNSSNYRNSSDNKNKRADKLITENVC